jgi:hypothetical protein
MNKMKRLKLSIHQHAAITWLLASPMAFSPLLKATTRPDAEMIVAQGILLVTAITAVVPLLLKWPSFRRWFCWTEALSERQRHTLVRCDLRLYYLIGFKDGYISRVLPYTKRIVGLFFFLMVVDMVMPKDICGATLDVITMFPSLYLMGVVLLQFVSCPFCSMSNFYR